MITNWLRNYLTSLALAVGLLTAGSPAMAEVCGVEQTTTLYAGQTIDAGTVTVANDENNLYVTFSTANDWLLSETHLHVADSLAGIPTNKKGNPKIGNFTYHESHNPSVTEYTYTVAKSALSLDDNNSVVIAAHAVVVQLDSNGNEIANETGWGDGDPFVDRGSWATYFHYTWQECNGEPPVATTTTETAFAFGANDAICFLSMDFDNDGSGDFNRWGWSNGALPAGDYNFLIYAGAGQCDLGKGTHVGNLIINYDGSRATVIFTMTETDGTTGVAYNLVETHLYVGNEPLAKNNGEYTVAPGQYPTIHGELDHVTTDSYTITGLNGSIYVVAHATVDGFPVE